MKEIYELDVYRLSEELSDLIWFAFDKWPHKVQRTIGYQIVRSHRSHAEHGNERKILMKKGQSKS